MSDVKVLYHAQCFDGFASSAVFTRFYSEFVSRLADFTYQGVRHGPGRGVDVHLLDHPTNAIVDFRYSPSRSLHWWFDHHQSAFVSSADREVFEARALRQHFWDPEEPSCAGFMVRRLRDELGVELSGLDSLVDWADCIDSADFFDAESVVMLDSPVLRLMTVCEHLQDGYFAHRLVDALSEGLLEEFAEDSETERRFEPLLDEQLRGQQVVESKLRTVRDVVVLDLAETGPITVNKFLCYYLVPETTYVVMMVRHGSRGVRLSVGSNPWRPHARRHNIAALCEAFGGGGHPVVGGISLPHATLSEGREVLRHIVDVLSSPEPVQEYGSCSVPLRDANVTSEEA